MADGFGPQPLFFCLLAETNDESRKVVGYSIYFYTYSTWAGRAMYLEDLFVDLPFRKLGTWPISTQRLADRFFFFLVGLGEALLRATAADAVRRGCARLNLQVLDWNTPSIQFYDSTGGKALKEWLTYRWEGASLKQLAGQ